MPDYKSGYPSIDKSWLKYYSCEAIETPLPECTVWEYVRDANQDNLGSVALSYYGRDMTYGELFAEVDRAASALVALGVREGDMVTAAMLNTPEAIVLMLALNKVGAVANMVFVTESGREMSERIALAGSKVLFALDAVLDTTSEAAEIAGLERVVVVGLSRSMSVPNRLGARLKGSRPRRAPRDPRFISWDSFMALSDEHTIGAYDPDAVAVVVYTGGTTGGSKGVMLTNRQVVAVAAQAIMAEEDYRRSDSMMQVLPPFIAFGVTLTFVLPLAIGMKLVLRLPMTDSIALMCKKFKPNHIVYGPAYWEKFAKEWDGSDLGYLRGAACGGDSLPLAVEQEVNDCLKGCGAPYPLLCGYGMTEVGATVCMGLHKVTKFGSVGLPLPHTVISAFDPETGEELLCGQVGELCITGPSMMKGYLGNAAATAEIVRRHPDGLSWVHSGDLGYVDEDGFVFVNGRMKRYLLRIGDGIHKKVFSLDVERALLAHPFVANCVVVARDDDEENQVPVAFIIPAEGFQDDEDIAGTLASHCESALDKWHRPVDYRFVEAFPLTKVGKVDYRELERRAVE